MVDKNSNYPIGVDPLDKSAPWNQEIEEPKKVKVCCIQGLSKSYEIENTASNLYKSFKEDEKAFNIPYLLQELQILLKMKIDELSAIKYKDETVDKIRKGLVSHYEDVLEASKGWILDDEDVCSE